MERPTGQTAKQVLAHPHNALAIQGKDKFDQKKYKVGKHNLRRAHPRKVFFLVKHPKKVELTSWSAE